MTDDQLLAAADLDAPDHDTSALLDMLEQQLQLRQTEIERLGEWERQVRETAGPAAEPLVAEVRAQFTGSIPVIRADSGQQWSAPAPQQPTAQEAGPAPVESTPTPTPQSVPELDLALADAPPPFGAAATDVPPPSPITPEDETTATAADEWTGATDDATPVADDDSGVPPPLVEPEQPSPVDPEVVTGSTSLEAIFGAAGLAGDQRDPASADTTDVPVVMTEEQSVSAVGAPATDEETADVSPMPGAALGFDALLQDPEPGPAPATDDLPGASERSVPMGSVPVAVDPSPSLETDTDTAGAPVRPANPPLAQVERIGAEPTPAEQRAGASVRLFWLWFAVNASVVSIGLGAVIFSLGMSLRQAILATLVGVAISFLPLGLGTLAGKWSGQPTMIVSRATFGFAGNIVPAAVALVSRALWASALLWMLAAGIAEILVGAELVTTLGRLEVALIAGGLGLALSALVAGFGYAMIAVVSAVVSALASVLVVGIIVLTVEYVDLDLALSVSDGSWALMVTGAVLVFSVIGLAWANSSGDVARYQGTGTVGAAAVLWATFGATVPSFLLISWGAVLAASNPFIAEGLVANPLDLVSRLLPLWYPIPLIAAVALSLLAAAALALYSGGFALQAVGARVSRPIAVLITVVPSGALLAALLFVVPDLDVLFRDVVTTLAVPIAAWAGIFGAETMIRSQRVHAASLVRSGGVYPAIRWVNLVMLLVATALGWGLTTATVVGLDWQGYAWPLVGLPAEDALLSSDLGVMVALVVGLLTPIVAGIPALRKLQRAERAALEPVT